tara:strand:- start:789 stop:3851 length:3063 start_codon:yes stop_codon:yes gene_type:complete
MMGAAEAQVYQKNAAGAITGLQPYKPFSTNAQDYVAPFSPLQQQAQTSAANLQTPGQFASASQMAGMSGMGQLGTAGQALGYGAQGANLGMGSAISSANQAGQQQTQAGMYGAQGMNVGMGSALSSANQAGQQQAQAGMYGAQGAGYGQNAANVGAMGGLGYGAQSANLGMQAAGMAGQGYGAGSQYAQQATDPNSVSAYMSPYMQNVMQQQGRELNRNYDISGAQQQGQATQAGAFGGSREALMASENERNRNMALNKMQAEGMQNAYTAANANQQFGANLSLQGMQAGNQAMQTGLQGIGQGITGVNTALQGYQQGMSGAQAGLQGVAAQTNASQMQQAGAGQALQGVGYGLQGVSAQTNASQMGQQGVAQGIQGVQAGLQGVQGAQAGFTGAVQAAGTMGNLGQQQLAAGTSIIGTQGQVGGQQQAQQQQAIDQSILDYKNAQQYPYMQLGTMSNLIRGIPMTNQTTTQYQAQPSAGSQIGGLAAAGLGAYTALKAEGGAIKDKGYAKGGIVGYKDKGWVEESMMNKLEDLDKPHLQTIIQKNTSPVQTGLAKEVLATKLAKGGIVAFAEGEDVKSKDKDKMPDLLGDLAAQEDVIQEKIKKQKGIKQAPINTNTAGITPVQAATLGPMSKDESLKNMALNQAEGVTPPLQASGIKAVEAPSVADKVLAPATTPFNLDQAMADQQQDVEKLRLDANKDEDTLIAEDRKRREEQLGPDTATAEYRKKIMDERANAPDEARRQMGMRLMEFGANWASTPGAPLVAGMRALKEGLPGVMEDTKANKKAMKDIDASIYQLDHADRLEQMGYLDRAVAKKEKAQELFMKAAPQVIDAGVKKEQLMQQDEANKAQAAHYRATEGNQAAQLAQQASQFAVTSAQPTTASMAADYMKNATLPKDKGGEGLSNAEAYTNMQRMQHPSSSTDSYVEKSLLANVKTYENSAAKAAESYANMPSEESKAALITARAAADSAKLDSLNFRREKQGLPPLDNLPENPPPVPVPTAQNNGVKKGWSVTPVNK